MVQNHSDEEVILRLGCEGGTIDLYGKEKNGEWYYSLQTNEIALLDFIDDDDELSKCLISNSAIVKGFSKGIRLLDKYPWAYLSPMKIHPLFAKRILLEVKRRTPNDRDRIYKWERVNKWSVKG